MRRFLILAKANMLMNVRNRTTLFWNFAFPVGLILLYGLLWPNVISWLAAGIMVMNIMSSGLLGDSARLSNLRGTKVVAGVDDAKAGLKTPLVSLELGVEGGPAQSLRFGIDAAMGDFRLRSCWATARTSDYHFRSEERSPSGSMGAANCCPCKSSALKTANCVGVAGRIGSSSLRWPD